MTRSNAYLVPDSSELLAIKDNMFVIVGAGPTGLMAALTLYHQGYRDVVILEKRATFDRMNIVNFHRETLMVLKQLGIVESFSKAASPISKHTDFVFRRTDEKVRFEDINTQERYTNINANQTFEPKEVPHLYNDDTLYSISLRDLQKYLASMVLERGIPILPNTQSRVFSATKSRYSIEFWRSQYGPASVIHDPRLIILANGSNSDIFRSLGGHYFASEGPKKDEYWLFGNYEITISDCFVNSLVEFSKPQDIYNITNYIFVAKTQEVNVATRVFSEEILSASVEEILLKQARKLRSFMQIPFDEKEPTWITRNPVHTGPKQANQFSWGHNIVLIGDAAGTCSPISGLGCTLGISAYQYAIGRLVQDLETLNTETALAQYCQKVESYLKKWNTNTCKHYQKIQDRVGLCPA